MIRSCMWLGLFGLAVWAVMAGSRWAFPYAAKWFEVRDVIVTGNSQVNHREALERLALAPHQTLLTLSPGRLETRLESHPWIKQAKVSRSFPHTLAVTVTERRPVAVLQDPSITLLLDEDGHVLQTALPYHDPALPVLIGVNGQALAAKQSAQLHTARQGLELAGLLGRTFQGHAEIDLRDPENIVASLDGLHVQFGKSAFAEKWDRYRKLEPYLAVGMAPARGEARNEIDLRYPAKVIIRERG